MKTLHRTAVCAAALVLFAHLGSARAEDPERDRKARAAFALAAEPKLGKDRDRDARAALAFSQPTAHVFLAPPPKAKDKSCICGDCKCKPGVCLACPTAKKDLARIRDSLVRVRTSAGSGSGTVVWSQSGRSLVATAYHVVEKGTALEVRSEGRWHRAQILRFDQAADVAALVVEAELPAVEVAAEDPADGDEVLLLGVTSLWSRGRIAGEHGPRRLISCDSCADYSDSGDSGGGVFAGGKLVGVHCGKLGATREKVDTPYCAGGTSVRAVLATCFAADGVTLAELPKAKPSADFEWWLINGQLVQVPKGQRPACSGPSCSGSR